MTSNQRPVAKHRKAERSRAVDWLSGQHKLKFHFVDVEAKKCWVLLFGWVLVIFQRQKGTKVVWSLTPKSMSSHKTNKILNFSCTVFILDFRALICASDILINTGKFLKELFFPPKMSVVLVIYWMVKLSLTSISLVFSDQIKYLISKVKLGIKELKTRESGKLKMLQSPLGGSVA